MTSDSDSTLVRLRRQNGATNPGVPYLPSQRDLGCGADAPRILCRRVSPLCTFIKNYSGNHIQKLAVGHTTIITPGRSAHAQAASEMQGLSLHY